MVNGYSSLLLTFGTLLQFITDTKVARIVIFEELDNSRLFDFYLLKDFLFNHFLKIIK